MCLVSEERSKSIFLSQLNILQKPDASYTTYELLCNTTRMMLGGAIDDDYLMNIT